MFKVYALYNKENRKIYIGQTGNIEKRLEEHNKKRGNHFTSKLKGDWVIIYEKSKQSRKLNSSVAQR
ncbi:MAG: GIY-YIG nuclease family protein [Patescibacteria group bacterium]